MADSFNEGFILLTLKKQIQKILEQYPDDGQILKELIQNAEDAGASEIKFLYDKGSYGTNSLYNKELAEFQGPALYAGNDAEFTEDDWKGIRMLNDSVKEDDPLKVGRFGLGFKSVFHMTDLPGLMSGDYVAYLDPHQVYFREGMTMTSSYRWNIGQEDFRKFKDQFEPFKVKLFDASDSSIRNGHYTGTLFRFPFRKEGSRSEVSKTVYNDSKVSELFESFKFDAHAVLLFLKSLEKIELYERNNHQEDPKILFRVQITPDCLEEVRRKRKEFIGTMTSGNPIETTYPITIETTDFSNASSPKVAVSSWLVSQVFGGKVDGFNDVKRLPWVGIAAPLGSKPAGAHGITDNTETVTVKGQVFCFLPLPLPEDGESVTKFPFHVNGYFAVDHNRRHLKWPTPGSGKDQDVLWNQHLLKQMLPKALFQVLKSMLKELKTKPLKMIEDSSESRSIQLRHLYSTLRSMNSIDHQWKKVMEHLPLELIKKLDFFYTKSQSGLWLTSEKVIFNTLASEGVAETKQIVILRILQAAGTNIVNVPSEFLEACRSLSLQVSPISPDLVAQAFKKIQDSQSFAVKEVFMIIEYIGLERIVGLKLLPLADGTMTYFNNKPRNQEQCVYIETERFPRTLLPRQERHFACIDSDSSKFLKNIAKKGHTQLLDLNKDSVATLLPNVLPSTWGSPAEIWNPGSGDHPTTKWLEQIWKFLYNNYSDGIEKFENLHLLPDMDKSPKQMIRIAFDYPVIAPQGKSNGLSNSMLIILEKVGCRVLRSLPDYIRQHPRIENYTQESLNSPGLMNILEKMYRQNPSQFTTAFQQLDRGEIKELKEFLVANHLDNISSQNIQFMRTLPLFSIWNNPSHPLARLDQKLKGSPNLGTYFPNVRHNGSFLDLSDDISRKIAERCLVFQMEIGEYVSKYLLAGVSNSFYSHEEVQKIMKEVMMKYYDLSSYISDLSSKVQRLRFLGDSSRTLHTPNELFDPLDELLRSMLDDKDRFPHPDWQNCSSTLKLCGLKGCADVNADELYNIAKEIERKGKPSNQSRAFLRYISKYPDKLQHFTDHYELGEHLKNICWVECCTLKPNAYPQKLGWKGESATLVKPCELKSDKYNVLVGSQLYVQPRHFETSPKVTAYFGWKVQPDIDIVLQQLKNVISCYTDSEKSSFFNVVKGIYEYFQALGSHQVKAKLFGSGLDAWVWQGNGFVKASSVVLNTPTIDMKPYVYGLPRELKYLEGFFSECGVEKDCGQMKVLKQIKEYHDYKVCQSDEVKRDLKIALEILEHTNEQVVQRRLDPNALDLLIPVHSDDPTVLKLMPREECIYYDVEWLKGQFDVSDTDIDEDELNPLHKRIPIHTAENLKIPTFTSHVLEPEELDMSYGQSEPLTRRLNNLLKEYTDGFAVPKELIQNADDAGATEVKFLYDERKNEDAMTCLIGDGMKECQGPAFWAYNNASFSDEDFENIVKLSGATKEEQTEKIGRFGLGFNAVYNLTDVPSFVSRHNFVVFDPHTTYLGRIIKDKSKPGIKLDMEKKPKKYKAFKNQFKPYNQVFGCNLNPEGGHSSFGGTLFRFPLRTVDQAQKSEISKLHYSGTEMKELIKMLEKGADSLLLFTQNILKISVYHMKEDAKSGDDMMEIFTVTKARVTILKELSISRALSAVTKMLPKAQKELVEQSNILGEAGLAIRKGTPDPKDICNSMIIKIGMTQGNQQRFEMDDCTRECLWLTTAAMGRNTSYEKAKKDKSLVPVGGAAIRLQRYGNKYCISELEHGQLFCFLPLPVPIKLPIHLNGTFALTSNRRTLYEKTMDDKKADYALWNESLLEDAVCNAFIRLLVDLTNICDTTKYSYHALWPQCHQASEMLKHFTMTVYKKIATDEDIKVFSDSNQWAALKDVLFLEEDVQNSEIGPTALKILQEVESRKGSGTIATAIPTHIRENFKYSKCEELLKKRTLNLHTFFGKVFFPYIETISAEDRNLLIGYALLKNDTVIDEMLRRSECIPVQCTSGGLKRPSSLIHPKGKASSLYTLEDGRFPETEAFKTSKELPVLTALVRVGMIKDELPWTDVIERAQTISALPHKDGYKRSKAVFAYIDYRLRISKEKEIKSEELQEVKNKLIKTEFCPVLQKPQNYPFKWQGDSQDYTQMLAPCDLYLKDSISLVGSVCLIMDDVPKAVTEFLGLKGKPISPDDVFKQLDIIIASSITLPRKCECVIEMEKVCLDIYRYLSDKMKKDETIADILRKKSFLLISGTFIPAGQCAFEFGMDASPYLFKLPYSYQIQFETLMKASGVRETFSPQFIVHVIKYIKSEHQNKPLDENKLAIIVNLLTEFTKLCHTGKEMPMIEIEQQYGCLYIPNTHKILKEAKVLYYNPQILDWLNVDEEMDFIHPTVSPQLAATLGLNTYRDGLVIKHSEPIDLGIPFGQKEELTTRIRGILEGYPCDVEILKELVQNADDAEATEIHFVLDSRTHPQQKMLSPTWHTLQGPALLVYNNKPFTHEDIIGIQKLGIGSKGNDPSKTGQYGVGFNCVYHLTDVPTFVTTPPGREKVLCAFDPCCEYVNRAKSASPGIMIEYNMLRERFQDVLVPFLEKEFNTDKGTLFRLPLRSKKSAISSPVHVENIKDLFDIFIEEMSNSLLFLNSLRKISVSRIDANSERLVPIFTVQASVDKSKDEELSEFNRVMKKKSKSMADCPVYNIPYQEMTYEMITEDSSRIKQKWLITKCIGCTQQKVLPDPLKKALDDGDIKLLPKGGVAVCLTKLLQFDNHYGRLYCLLPLPSKRYLPLHINGHFALDHENRRALWSGKDTDHRTQWNNMLFTDTLSQAYVNLIQHMTTMVTDGSLPLAVYHSLFPDAKIHGNYLKDFTNAVYKCINNEARKVLPVNRQNNIEWHTSCETGYKKVFFDNLELQVEEKNKGLFEKLVYSLGLKKELPINVMVRQTLLDCGLNLLAMPISIKESFTSSGVHIQLISPGEVIEFLKSFQLRTSPCYLGLDQLPADLQVTTLKSLERYIALLEYCLKAEEIGHNLDGLPLLLGADHRLHEFSSSCPKFLSYYINIIKLKQRSQFVHPGIVEACLKLQSPCFKKFQVKDFAALLPEILHVEIFRVRKSVKLSDGTWIKDVWDFLNDCRNAEPNMEAKSILGPLNDWSLLPTIQNRSQSPFHVIPIGKASTVIDTDVGGSSTKILRMIMKKFGIPEPCYSAIGFKNMSLVRSLVGNIDSPHRMIQALGELIDRKEMKREILEIGEAEAFLLYMKEQLGEVKKVAKAVQILQQLPLFLDVFRQLVPIYGKTVYVHPRRDPNDDLNKLDEEKSIVFLKHNVSLKKLFEYLGCRELNEVDFYREVIFPNFQILSKEAQIAHFKYLSTRIQCDDFGSTILLQNLKKLCFIKNSQGSLVTASQFLSPSVGVFKMFERNKILPAEWHQVEILWYGWLPFLENIGLKNTPTVEQIVHYAKQVEYLGFENQKIYREISEALLKCIFQRENILHDGLLDQIKNIKFVVPYKVPNSTSNLHSQYGEGSNGQLPFFCFSGSVLPTEKLNCCWTSAAVLGTEYGYSNNWRLPITQREEYTQLVLKKLNIQSLSIELAANHLATLCFKLQKEMVQPGYKRNNTFELKQILRDIYHYLQSKDFKTNREVESKLQRIPSVLVKDGILLVKPSQIALQGYTHQEIEPYLYIMPMEIGNFNRLFSQLGATAEFTLTQYAFVLQEVYSKSNGGKLEPNEMIKIIKAMKGLFNLIKEGKRLEEGQRLYLLSTKSTLELSNQMMYIDDASWESRLSGFEGRLLAETDEMGMGVEEIHACLKTFPQNLQPKKLTKEIVEKLEDGLKDLATVDGALATNVRNKLRAEEFIQGMKRIMHHELDGQSASLDTFKEKLERFEMAMHNINVLEVGNLKTFLTLHGRRIPESEMEKDYYAEYDTWTIYLKKMALHLKSSMNQIVGFLDEITQNIFGRKCISEKLLWVYQILEADSDQIPLILDGLSVKRYGASSARRRYMPTLGTLVPIDLLHLLQANFEDFEVGDYVAYEVFDELYNLEDDLEDNEGLQEGYIYAQIKKQIPNAGNDHIFSRRYEIDVGNGEILTVPGVMLYKFIRTSVASDGTLVVYEGTNRDQDGDTVDSKPEVEKDVKTVCNEISDQLEAAWKCSDAEKKTIIKRLLRKWHPDKNYGNEAFATEVFKYLKNEIERLEKGLPRPSEDERHNPQYRHPRDDYDGFYRAYYEETGQRARADRERHYQYGDKFKQHSRSHRHTFGGGPKYYDVPPTFQKHNPQPGEAKRWLRQAQFDLNAVPNDLPDASEWVCFKCHQAAEKALKAARFAEDAWWDMTHELNQIASGLDHPEIQGLASRLQSLLGDSAKMRYPDKHYRSRIPHDHYTVDIAMRARDITKKLVDLCRKYIYNRI